MAAAQIIIDQINGLISIGGSNVLTGAASVANPQVSITADSASINATETYLTSMNFGASSLSAGNTFRITGMFLVTSSAGISSSEVLSIRLGTAGTTSDTAIMQIGPTGSGGTPTNGPVWFDFLVTVRTSGSSGVVQVAGGTNSTNSIDWYQDYKTTNTTSINTTSTLKLGVSLLGTANDTLVCKMLTIAQVS